MSYRLFFRMHCGDALVPCLKPGLYYTTIGGSMSFNEVLQASNSKQPLLAHHWNTFEFSDAEVGDIKKPLSGLIMSLIW
jgi:hypothetical protein